MPNEVYTDLEDQAREKVDHIIAINILVKVEELVRTCPNDFTLGEEVRKLFSRPTK